ncbi:hypothetical protein [Amycolatopsis sp. NPDC057786]|uniref:hypothetical protein n=1 Tax=Amycolatopsis sp. NPDC057786 TaxID=3346250 RepID=UPI00367179E3
MRLDGERGRLITHDVLRQGLVNRDRRDHRSRAPAVNTDGDEITGVIDWPAG